MSDVSRLAARASDERLGTARDLYDPGVRRRPHPAWGVLVSEIMLQQTPVHRVAAGTGLDGAAGRRRRRWPKTWTSRRGDPDVGRARIPAPGAAAARVRGRGRTGTAAPSRPTSTRRSPPPGVGSYTARAVAAFAYGQRHPVVDTNVRRLVARAVTGLADARRPTRADLAPSRRVLPADRRRRPAGARDGARRADLHRPIAPLRRLPARGVCAWRLAGAPAGDARPTRRPQAYAGTDRQVRGLLLAVLRDADRP